MHKTYTKYTTNVCKNTEQYTTHNHIR